MHTDVLIYTILCYISYTILTKYEVLNDNVVMIWQTCANLLSNMWTITEQSWRFYNKYIWQVVIWVNSVFVDVMPFEFFLLVTKLINYFMSTVSYVCKWGV